MYTWEQRKEKQSNKGRKRNEEEKQRVKGYINLVSCFLDFEEDYFRKQLCSGSAILNLKN